MKIEDKINNSLAELEESLREIKSASRQVKEMKDSYGNLNGSIAEYVEQLDKLSASLTGFVNSTKENSNSQLKEFEDVHKLLMDSAKSASKNLAATSDTFQSSVKEVEKELLNNQKNLVSAMTEDYKKRADEYDTIKKSFQNSLNQIYDETKQISYKVSDANSSLTTLLDYNQRICKYLDEKVSAIQEHIDELSFKLVLSLILNVITTVLVVVVMVMFAR